MRWGEGRTAGVRVVSHVRGGGVPGGLLVSGWDTSGDWVRER